MGESIQEMVAAVDALSTVTEAGDVERLVGLVDAYFVDAAAAEHLDAWFRLFERFPEEDAHEVFWAILHGIEDQAGYEPLVVASVRRRPARFPVLMVNRMLNAGDEEVLGVRLMDLLREVAADERCLPSVRAHAERFLKLQMGRRS